MKRKLLLSILAVFPAMFMPLAANGQVAKTAKAVAGERIESTYKYAVMAGYSYTSLNQVNQSRHGLQGVNVAVTRNFGRFFGITADAAQYRYPLGTGNPGKPTVTAVFLGPELHANLYGRIGGLFHVLLGGEHTGGEGMTPNISFAGGVGAGLEYSLSKRLSIRATGDDIAASFSLSNNTPALAYSPHMHRNSRATFGVVYRF